MFVIIADDRYGVRCALRLLLEHESNLVHVSEAVNTAELLSQLTEVCPDLILLDWELPGLPNTDVLATVSQMCPDAKIVALSGRPEACEQATKAGIQGFVSKGDPPERLLGEVRRVLSCSSYRC